MERKIRAWSLLKVKCERGDVKEEECGRVGLRGKGGEE